VQSTPTTAWTGDTPVDNQTVQIVGDGLVQLPVAVSSSGGLTLTKACSTLYAGLGYTSTLNTLPFSFSVNGKLKRGLYMRKIRTFAQVYNTQALNVDGYDVAFRFLGSSLLDQPLPSFTGTVSQRLGNENVSTDPYLAVTVSDPVPATVLAISTDLEVRDEPP
jgi:hypothetical protein